MTPREGIAALRDPSRGMADSLELARRAADHAAQVHRCRCFWRSCTDAPLCVPGGSSGTYSRDDGNAVMTVGQVLSSVQLQAGNAAGVAAKTAARLESPDPIVISAFANTFGVKHDSSWRAPGPGTGAYGRIVRQRFLGAHRLLKSGSLLYSCWGRPTYPGGPELDPDYLVLVQPGQYWIALGRRYWEAVHNRRR